MTNACQWLPIYRQIPPDNRLARSPKVVSIHLQLQARGRRAEVGNQETCASAELRCKNTQKDWHAQKHTHVGLHPQSAHVERRQTHIRAQQ